MAKADEGLPLTQDLTANTTFKVAGNGDRIFGRLEFVDTGRALAVGTIAFEYICKWNLEAGDVLTAVGDTVCGSTTRGYVKKAAANDPNVNYVISKTGQVVTVART